MSLEVDSSTFELPGISSALPGAFDVVLQRTQLGVLDHLTHKLGGDQYVSP